MEAVLGDGVSEQAGGKNKQNRNSIAQFRTWSSFSRFETARALPGSVRTEAAPRHGVADLARPERPERPEAERDGDREGDGEVERERFRLFFFLSFFPFLSFFERFGASSDSDDDGGGVGGGAFVGNGVTRFSGITSADDRGPARTYRSRTSFATFATFAGELPWRNASTVNRGETNRYKKPLWFVRGQR
jgi:hypothetical protein